ncbi:MAG TPA: hypothetical protein VFA20_14990, partial [Myxococcaceae bacterium]|nr:hypothetical protein [Myxococcaceae bacterium]
PAPPAEAPATLEGTAAPGALVFVSKGLEAYAFARSGEPADLAHDREGFVPRALGVQVGQELRLRSADGRLHTLLAKKVGGGWVRNVPITGGGETRVTFDEPVGAVTLECKVHGASEAPGMMAILDHPSWTVADASGRFSLRVALSGEGEVTAASPGSAPVTRPYRVGAGQRVEVTLK